MKKLKEQIRFVLLRVKQARDNDNLLTWILWQRENSSIMNNMEVFKVKFCNNQMINPVTVARIRRQVQVEFPETRGEKYKNREMRAKQVKRDLGYNVNELF
tara:strand:- start:550 stop:852 length:303 start_codon:yes stop_codon:yes gene_type:complete